MFTLITVATEYILLLGQRDNRVHHDSCVMTAVWDIRIV